MIVVVNITDGDAVVKSDFYKAVETVLLYSQFST